MYLRWLLRVHALSEYMNGILFDMDGVVYNSETLISGAPETLAWARAQGIAHMFVTNTTSRGRGVLVEKLAHFGIPATEDDILTPCIAAREYMLAQGGGPVALFVPQNSHAEFSGLPLLDPSIERGARWVVVGDLGSGWDFATLNRAFRLLQSTPEATLVALGMTRFWQAGDGLRLDTAPYVAALECATGRKAVVLGKPAEAFFHAAALKLRLAASEVLMIGDDVHVDVGGAQAAGLKGALVKTGKYREGDLTGSVRPDFVLDSIAGLQELWTEMGPHAGPRPNPGS
ncbi:MAG: TIGR01458 family HAD-type hydrolase [Acidobacteriota bacterium]